MRNDGITKGAVFVAIILFGALMSLQAAQAAEIERVECRTSLKIGANSFKEIFKRAKCKVRVDVPEHDVSFDVPLQFFERPGWFVEKEDE